MSSYRHRVTTLLRPLLEKISPPLRRALDFGAGDGWFAATFANEGLVDEIVAVDVLPRRRTHAEVLRYDGYLLLKDHTYESWPGWLALCALDEIGNRRFGVPSIHKYQHRREWLPWFEEEGFVLETLVHPAARHTGILGRTTNSLQFVALWRRA